MQEKFNFDIHAGLTVGKNTSGTRQSVGFVSYLGDNSVTVTNVISRMDVWAVHFGIGFIG